MRGSKARKWLVPALLGVAVLGYAGYAWAQSQKPKPKKAPSPKRAVAKAIEMLGPKAKVVDITDVAYTLAYPKCPPKLDPENPKHEKCIGRWLKLRDEAVEQTKLIPPPRDTPKSKPGEPTPKAPPKKAGPASEVNDWANSLTGSQRSGVRSIIGANRFDSVANAAKAGDDSGTVSGLLRVQRWIEGQSVFVQLQKYNELKSLLGPKLDTFERIIKKYQ